MNEDKSKHVQLDKFLLRNSTYSLQQLRKFILNENVTVNSAICKDIHFPVHTFTSVTLNEEVIQEKNAHYIMLNKPKGVVSATSHQTHKTVINCITEPYSTDLHLAGRLDFNTTGLVILTNDGHFSRALTQPEKKTPKTYKVQTEKPITQEYSILFEKGMYFKYEGITLMPANLNILGSHQARLTIYEGRYHQIKRMFGFFDNKVTALHRESIGEIHLDSDLQAGQYRALSANEARLQQ